MSETLGQHLLIDLYACLENTISSLPILQNSLMNALASAQQQVNEISTEELDEEFILFALANQSHVTMHAYPHLGYVAVDIYSFNRPFDTSIVMRELKKALGSDRVKATSVQRGDFGSERDMKPRRQSSLSTIGRVTRTRTRLKNTGVKLRNKGQNVIKVIKNRNSQD